MINLHTHSYYSVLDGLGSVEKIVEKAKSMGQKGVGITDHASISCMPDLLKNCKKHNINPILGCEFYVTDTVEKVKKEKRYHLTVWAKNWAGVQSIMKQLSLANQQFYYRPRIDFKQALNFENCFIGTACCFGVLSHDNYEVIYSDLLRQYGENLFLEIMPHKINLPENPEVDRQQIVNERAEFLKAKIGGKYLLTNDAHYVNKEDSRTHQILLCTQYKKNIEDFDGWNGEFYIKSQKEMIISSNGILSLAAIKEGIENTNILSSLVNIEKPNISINLPLIYPDDDEAFLRIVLDGWTEKINGIVDDILKYHERLIYEISIIKKMGFGRYFLIVHDMIHWARTNDIMVGPARGSSAGSLVCYLMDIVQVDPLKFGLYFERFLNPDRVEMPDIDVDFQDDRREEVFNYVRDKYGPDKTAFINTFSRVSVKSAFRDVARSFKISPIEVNALSKQIEDKESFDNVTELQLFKENHPEIVAQSIKLDGTIRQVGSHACGFVISNTDLNNVCVLERRKRTGGNEVFVTNWDKRESENFGLLKVDILGLITLSVLNQAKKLIKKRTGDIIDFTKIDLKDERTINLFQQGETMGVFQFEGSGMQGLLRSIKPTNFREITDCTALYRPGSLQSGQTQQYVDIAKGETKIFYKTELLKPILSDTKGQLVYQEQIMQIFNQLGNFTRAESDKMRKIIGKKLGKDEFDKHKDHFVAGCAENKISGEIATELFDNMAEFASYSFNLSHAVSYTLISFWTAYLKVYHPVEFFAATLSHAKDDRVKEIAIDAKRLKIEIDIPEINVSGQYYQIDSHGNIRYPLSAIKGVGGKAVATILKARAESSFKSLDDFLERIEKRSCNKRVVEKLIKAGAFENLGLKEIDPSQRRENFVELIAGFSDLPSLSLRNTTIKIREILSIIGELKSCSNLKAKKMIMPHMIKPMTPNIMIINNLTKRQKHLLSGKVGTYLLHQLKLNGIRKHDIYATSVIKCESTEKNCAIKSHEILKREIKAVSPGLVVCFASQAIPLFEKTGKMGKLQGQVKYNAEFDTYVLYSYSPQYAYFQEDKAKSQFELAMKKLNLMMEI